MHTNATSLCFGGVIEFYKEFWGRKKKKEKKEKEGEEEKENTLR